MSQLSYFVLLVFNTYFNELWIIFQQFISMSPYAILHKGLWQEYQPISKPLYSPRWELGWYVQHLVW